MKNKIAILTTGGTIASSPNESGKLVANSTGQALINRLDSENTSAHGKLPMELFVDEKFQLPSPEMTVDNMVELARSIYTHSHDPSVAGIVVTHGTDTLEETAYLAHLVHNSDTPAIFTGSQRIADEPGFDGVRNLDTAIRMVADSRLRGWGVMVAFDGLALPINGTRKLHTTSSRPFGTRGRGPAAELVGTSLRLGQPPAAGPQLELNKVERPLPRVALVKLVAGILATTLDAIVSAEQATGVVVEGFGMGSVNEAILSRIKVLLDRGITVVVTSRCEDGPVVPMYGQGGAADVAESGAWLVGTDIPPTQLRLALTVYLACTPKEHRTPDEFRKLVDGGD